MKKIVGLISLILIFSCLTGCLTMEQREEKRNIEKETKEIMINYLKENYNIRKVSNVNAEYTMHGDIATSEFKNIVTGTFKKDGQEHQILYDYEKEKCYDSFSYINKINPIITDYIKSLLNKNSLNNIIKPDYVIIADGYRNYLKEGIYGLYNNNDNVKTYSDIQDYYGVLGLEIVYNNSNTIIENNLNAFENLYNELGIVINVSIYDNGILKEYLKGFPQIEYDDSGYEYKLYEIQTIGNFTAKWTIKEIITREYNGTLEQANFELNVVKNNSEFADRIELYGEEYYLYSQDILEVKDMSNNNAFNYIYLKESENVCNKHSEIVYNDNSYGLKSVSPYVSFESGMQETKKFAIYCKK
ncbi:MAG: hypothetical protein E7174_03980 [Firmicutes bacterium]|nr:hypothetical protein [Bacillota bacterium]